MTSVHQFTRNRANFCPVLVDEPRGLILSFGDGIDRGMEPLRERLNFSIVVGAKRIKFGSPSAKPALRCATASQFDHGATGDFYRLRACQHLPEFLRQVRPLLDRRNEIRWWDAAEFAATISATDEVGKAMSVACGDWEKALPHARWSAGVWWTKGGAQRQLQTWPLHR